MRSTRSGWAVWLACVLLAACGGSAEAPVATLAPGPDPHSFARPDEVSIKHLFLNLKLDFDARVIHGQASLHLDNKRMATKLWLDTRELTIERITLDYSDVETPYTLGEPVEHLGRPLIVEISPQTQLVQIDYTTSPEAAALQWVTPRQTRGGRMPFVYTQNQPILARTWIPCQDTPAVRATYQARIEVPRGMLAVMSAENPTAKSSDGVYSLSMPEPIPSYLIALAAGDLAFRELGPRSGVYAEPEVLDAAAHEFADTEQMMAVNESLYGPYRWGRYDLLVLPPSFPFGGMENPRLSFLTPTILAGDRSLNALVAHELAHSWSGNLVTNSDWNGLWLNEGFTVYLERRVMEEVYGRSYAEMLAQLGRQDLERELERVGALSRDSWLQLDLAGRDPDDGMSDVPYEKGYLFLRMLEETLGREELDVFLRTYFDAFAFRSIDSRRFVDYLVAEAFGGDFDAADRAGIDRWVFGPGLPDNTPAVTRDAFEPVDTQLNRLHDGAGAGELVVDGWNTHQWLHFLRKLPPGLGQDGMTGLDARFGFTDSGNSEILHEWLMQSIERDYAPAYPALERFLTGQGRRKFLEPLYRKLAQTPAGARRAERIYAAARDSYHPVSAMTIDELLR